MKQIVCIGGFGWKHGDDRAGWETFIERVRKQEEDRPIYEPVVIQPKKWNDEIYRYTYDHNKGPFVLVGRSWGAARLYKFADDNPDVTIDLAITFDPIPNPMWLQFGKWQRRKNIKRVVSFLQHENILLRGLHIDHKAPYHYRPGGAPVRETDWFTEYNIPNSFGELKSLGHVSITKKEFVINTALKEIAEVK